jgi:3-hydroxyisobutyrate dehydrogenase-like beta-hydroxyacid dehydrogenase
MIKTGFVGLGQMGKHMALNMAKQCGGVTVYDVPPQATLSLRQREFPQPQPFGNRSGRFDFFEPAQRFYSGKCVFGKNGLASRLAAGQTVVDLSTITYSATVKIHGALTAMGVHFLDAPVSGMESRAKDGTLTVMCGGDFKTFELAKPYFEAIGNNLLFMGAPGSGQLAKLINQLLFDINAAALAEILPMAVQMGLDPVKTGSIINSGTGKSYASEFFIPRILNGDFTQGYFLKNATRT